MPASVSTKTPHSWPGISENLAKRLSKLNLHCDQDLILHLPLRYEDETHLTPLRDLQPGQTAQVEGLVVANEIVLRPRRQWVLRIAQGSAELTLRFLHFYPSQQKSFPIGSNVRAFGEVRPGFWGDEMVHPKIRPVSENSSLPTALTPVYPSTAGLAQSALQKLIQRALAKAPFPPHLPPKLETELALPSFEQAVRTLHNPSPDISANTLGDRQHPVWQRIKFEELLVQQLSLKQAYLARREKSAPAISPASDTLRRQLLAQLPFTLTRAQQHCYAQISADLAQAYPMQRLLQGDVGSGKTIVAALAMLQAAECGFQAALMAPTEILAEQHYQKLSAWLAPLGLEIGWISGSQKKSVRKAVQQKLAEGQLSLVVGTHALIEDPIALPRLALAVVDEQHRFGVRQRLALREKSLAGEWQNPHMLMMSATPIPRTLAMSYYADLDVSTLDELPPGRTPIQTRLVTNRRREEVIERVHQACLSGKQVYWVCPLIEESETLELQTAEETFANLEQTLPDLKIGLVHGRLKNDVKASVMAAFAAGEIKLLVATTVIEVGVDVPNASIMVIEHAERFGLAQLHQLRGRVGRGQNASSCILLYAEPLSQTARARLKTIYESTDGFAIAQADMQLRGTGEIVGTRQSGVPLLRFADIQEDAHLVEKAVSYADTLLKHYPDWAQHLQAQWVGSGAQLLKA